MSSNELAEIGIAKLSGALHTDVYSNPDAKGFSPNNVKGIEFLGSAGIEVVEHVQAGYYNLYRTGFDGLDHGPSGFLEQNPILDTNVE